MAVAEGKGRDGADFSMLPKGCIARVVSFTCPADACRLVSVSSVFKPACSSDAVWASFLLPDCRAMVSRSVLSPKEFYLSLCDDPVLVGDGKMVGAGFVGDEVGKHERSVYLSRENNTCERQPRLRYRSFDFGFLPAPFELVDEDDDYDGGPLPPTPAPAEGDGNYPKEIRDGWLEIELGEFLTKDGEDGEVELSVLETKGGNWKAGLAVEGIEISPKHGK